MSIGNLLILKLEKKLETYPLLHRKKVITLDSSLTPGGVWNHTYS